MINEATYNEVLGKFRGHFGCEPTVAAYAPGRVEVMGNHTDYNEGFVLSAAINLGTFFLAAPSPDSSCRLVAGDLMDEVSFDTSRVKRSDTDTWCNYVKGVFAGLAEHGDIPNGLLGMFLSCVPLGSGLSSSAALEISAGLALCELYGITLDKITLAKIGQKAEHEFAGVKCGLLDQITSLYGEADSFILTDFRSLKVETVAIGDDAGFIVCDTAVKHALVDGEYNARREACETAAKYFAGVLDHPVSALRDVSMLEWEAHGEGLDPMAAQRAAHPIGEDERVLQGRELLAAGNLEAFGKLMYLSHNSSRRFFENSCPELDFLVDTAADLPGVLGARLTGGGFGGSAVVLVHPRDADVISQALASAYDKAYGHPCPTRIIVPSPGATVVIGH